MIVKEKDPCWFSRWARVSRTSASAGLCLRPCRSISSGCGVRLAITIYAKIKTPGSLGYLPGEFVNQNYQLVHENYTIKVPVKAFLGC